MTLCIHSRLHNCVRGGLMGLRHHCLSHLCLGVDLALYQPVETFSGGKSPVPVRYNT